MAPFSLQNLPEIMVRPVVEAALLEDLGRAGDITSEAVIPPDSRCNLVLTVRERGVVAGLEFARSAFTLIDPTITFKSVCADGEHVDAGTILASIEGPARGVLMGERVALNFLGHLSGIASATARIVDAIKHTKAKIVCTRKTTPGLRFAEKYAIRAGGGVNHRFGLDDAILIKDNHIAIAGGVANAMTRAKLYAGHLVKIEVEVDNLVQLEEALHYQPDAILLDNMPLPILREAVNLIQGRAIAEASGGIRVETVQAVAETGVDLISAGWLTHSSKVLDIGLDFAG
ncbi:carboxylating nicotinate-nucleotide diphosphorylase [Acidocella sp.]|uniref:carboxylating nicotinate-nucleotide diphosphorylase n=1 Tax=Acidocella sp. TaxID=50710 RepID=UPI003D03D3BE